MKKEIGDRWKLTSLIGVGVFLIPILLNLLVFSWRLDTELPLLSIINTHGSIEGWLSFWGNLVGTIVSGCVAFLVAKITISEQSKKDEKIEADLLIIKQLPALIKVKIELDKILGELLRISGEKKEIIEEYRENRVVFTESELIFSLDYSILPINDENFKNIDTILHVDLQVDLIELQEFYTKFKSALQFDIAHSQQIVNKFMETEKENELYELLNSDLRKEAKHSYKEIFELQGQIQVNKDLRLKGWKKIEEEDYMSTLSSMFVEVDNRIELIRKKITEKRFYQ